MPFRIYRFAVFSCNLVHCGQGMPWKGTCARVWRFDTCQKTNLNLAFKHLPWRLIYATRAMFYFLSGKRCVKVNGNLADTATSISRLWVTGLPQGHACFSLVVLQKMHRARFLVNTLKGPNGQKFASWLLSKSAAPAVYTATSARCYNVPAQAEPFLNGSSSAYIEDMYNAWLADPSSVHPVSAKWLFVGRGRQIVGVFGWLAMGPPRERKQARSQGNALSKQSQILVCKQTGVVIFWK